SSSFLLWPSAHLTLHEHGGHRELGARETERFTRRRLVDTFDLEQDLAGQHLGHPVLDVALAGAHADFEGLLRHGDVGEHAVPHLAAALHVAGHGAARGFDLARRHAGAARRLEAVLAEGHGAATVREARVRALEHLAVFGALGLLHGLSTSTSRRRRGGGCGIRGGALRGLSGIRLGVHLGDLALLEHFALEDPHLDADHAIRGAGFAETVVDVGAEGVQRHAAFTGPLGAGDFRAVQTARETHLHAERAGAHRAHHRALHGAAEHHALLDLLRDAVGDQLRIELRLADLGDVEAHVAGRQLEHLGRLGAQLLDVLALLADHDARTRGLDRDVHALRGALDEHAADRRVGELLLQELAHAEIGVDVLRELLLARI